MQVVGITDREIVVVSDWGVMCTGSKTKTYDQAKVYCPYTFFFFFFFLRSPAISLGFTPFG